MPVFSKTWMRTAGLQRRGRPPHSSKRALAIAENMNDTIAPRSYADLPGTAKTQTVCAKLSQSLQCAPISLRFPRAPRSHVSPLAVTTSMSTLVLVRRSTSPGPLSIPPLVAYGQWARTGQAGRVEHQRIRRSHAMQCCPVQTVEVKLGQVYELDLWRWPQALAFSGGPAGTPRT